MLMVSVEIYVVARFHQFFMNFSLFCGITVQIDFHRCGSACTAVGSGDFHHSWVTVGLYLFKVVLNM